MKKGFLFLFWIFVCCSANIFSQVNSWQWAKTAVSNGGNYAIRTCANSNGGVYVSGYFVTDTICFGTDTLFHTNNFGSDIFLAKYDAAGNVLWAKNFASGRAYGDADDYDIAADGNGNVYFTAGLFIDSAVFGNFTLHNDTANSSYTLSDVVVVKCDSSGNVLWAKVMGGKTNELPAGICVDNHNNVFVTGRFNSSSIPFGNTTLATSAYFDVFIIKYDSLGNEVWGKSASGNNWEFGRSLASDALGNIYVTGFFNSDILHFDNILLFNSALNIDEFFIAKYDTNGNAIWAKKAVGGDDDAGEDVTVDDVGNIVATGYFRSPTLAFDNVILTNNFIAGYHEVFITKFDPLGNVIWAKNAGGYDDDIGTGICTDANNAVYVTGRYGLPDAIFGNDTCLNSGTSGTGDVFVVKYDSGGNELWVKTANGNGDDQGNSICIDSNGDIYVTGFYWISVSFGNIALNNTGPSGSEIFLAKLGATTGMQELFSKENLSPFPNPSSGNFTIKNNFSTNYQIEIFNSLGQEVFQKENLTENNFDADLSDQSNGIYFVRIISDGKIYSEKIIIEK
jgi:hypothetical protein